MGKLLTRERHYETPILKIDVGDEEARFNVNEGLLQSTSFLAKEKRNREADGDPPRKPSNENTRQSEDTRASYFSDTSERTIDPNEEVPTIDLTTNGADFVLKGKFCYTREAFAIFVRSLNDALPRKPQNQEDCRALFEAYALAQEYDFEKLQNEVIEALQNFYIEHTIPATDILYLIEHWGDKAECFLAGYLIAQTAYEMASDWSTYSTNNRELKQLFAGGAGVIVEHLFQAVAQYVKPGKGEDPAKQKRFWRFTI